MFSLKGRLKSKYMFEKFNALFYVCHLALIGYISYYLVFNVYLGADESVTPMFLSFLIITLFFSLTTINSHSDYANKNKFHKNTLDYYLADLNPSKGSFVYNIVIGKSAFHKTILHPVLFFISMYSFIMCLFGIFSEADGAFFLPFYNIVLIIISLFFGGALMNLIKVDSEKLNKFYELEDITLGDKKDFRQEIMSILEKEKKVTREDLMLVCIKIKKANSKRIEDAELEEQYQSFKQKKLL